MTTFEMVKYHSQEYPLQIPLRIEEVAAHFDIQKISPTIDYSLHTEYSYGQRKLNSALISHYPALINAQRNGIPQLWKDSEWAVQFADFIIKLVNGERPPTTIEVHSPFTDYTDIYSFVTSYQEFENSIKSVFPSTEILIENRCGSIYRGGKFLFSKMQDIILLCEAIDRYGLNLKIAFDIPQIYTAHNTKTCEDYLSLLNKAKDIRSFIGGVHLWGKRKSDTGRKVAHCGDLTSYFEDEVVKKAFLNSFYDCFNDSIIRKLVLEVNSGNNDLVSIVNDLVETGVIFA